MGTMVSRKLRELTDEDINKISDTYEAFGNGTLENIKGFCAVTDTAEIENKIISLHLDAMWVLKSRKMTMSPLKKDGSVNI